MLLTVLETVPHLTVLATVPHLTVLETVTCLTLLEIDPHLTKLETVTHLTLLETDPHQTKMETVTCLTLLESPTPDKTGNSHMPDITGNRSTPHSPENSHTPDITGDRSTPDKTGNSHTPDNTGNSPTQSHTGQYWNISPNHLSSPPASFRTRTLLRVWPLSPRSARCGWVVLIVWSVPHATTRGLLRSWSAMLSWPPKRWVSDVIPAAMLSWPPKRWVSDVIPAVWICLEVGMGVQDMGTICSQNSALETLWCAAAVHHQAAPCRRNACRTVKPTRIWGQKRGLLANICPWSTLSDCLCAWLSVCL